MKPKTWQKKDSTQLGLKIVLRRAYLPKKASVLDLFCGRGEIYKRVYQGNVQFYLGIDNFKIHDPNICRLAKNTVFVAHNDISRFNVFDLDDYGTPWLLLYLILRKKLPSDITIFMTDGLILKQKLSGKVTRNVSATEHIPRDMVIPAINRWYIDIFATMILDLESRYGWKTHMAKYIFNDRKTVCYWCLKMSKNANFVAKSPIL